MAKEGFEERLQQSMFQQQSEKSYIDKLLSKAEVDRVKELVKKERLNRSELLELLYMCLSSESKLMNISEWDRYIILKFFVWIREFIKIAELMYDYKEFLEKQEKEGIIALSPRAHQMLQNNERLIEHNAKFLIDLYLNIMRTTLSVGGTGFLELLKSKFELTYPQPGVTAMDIQPTKRFSLFGGKKE